MVLLDARKDIIAALVTHLETELSPSRIDGFPVMSNELSASDYPAISIYEGPSRVKRELTSTVDIELDLVIRMFTNQDDDLSKGRDLADALISAIENDPQLTDTCISCLAIDSDPPVQWPVKDGTHIYDQLVTVTYRRDKP